MVRGVVAGRPPLRRRVARLKESGNLGWSVAALVISLIALLPIMAIAVIALKPSGDTWPHLIENVLPGALRRTVLLMAGVGSLSLLIGTGCAWLVTMYRFPGRRYFQWLLLLPLAIPTYIIAYSYLELLDYSGVVQTALRDLFGWRDARSYWFPDIRSLGGATLVMSAVLYPYVYVTARASFIAQSVCVLEVSRTLGRTAAQTFRQVALPLARPALAAGVALALMETLNDIGAVEFFGVRTLTVAVYDTWLDRNDLAGAAQIACIMLLFVFAVLLLERAQRAKRRFHHTTGKYRNLPEEALGGLRGALAAIACALPVLFGFVLPGGVLVHDAIAHVTAGLAPEFWQAALNSLLLAGAAAVLAVGFAVILAYARRQTRSGLIQGASTLPAISYAVPGTVLAIGLLIPLAGLDNSVDAVMRSLFGVSTGLVLSGTAFAIVLAYTIRFLAASLGAVEAGLSKVSRNIDAAARTLGATISQMLVKVHLPLLRPALGAAALLVFVDSMKELPATLLLRPFNFDTLATQVFTLASLYRYEEAGLSALTIVAVSLAPVLLLHGIIVGTGRARRWAARLPPAQALNGPSAPRNAATKAGRWSRYLFSIGIERRGLSAIIRAGPGFYGPRSQRVGRDRMKLRQIPWKWLFLGLIVLLLAGLVIVPRQLGDSDRLAARVTDALSAWTGGEVKLTGPLRVQYFPDVAIKSGFEITNATRLPLVKSITTGDARLSLDLAELLLGRIKIDTLRLIKPQIALKEAPSMVMGPDQTLQARVANLLGGAPVDVLRLHDGTIEIPTATGTEALKKIDARFDVSAGTGAMSSFGSFQLRGETVRFALDCAAPSDMAEDLRIPVNLTFTAQPLTVKVTGTASFATGLQLDGDVQADMPSARDFLTWAGIGLPPARSLKKLSASGLAHWNGTTLTFDDGSFTLDGNEAVGLLAVTPGARPRIDGTLAFDRLALDPYLGTVAPAEQDVTVTASLGSQPLLKYFDADLRISAADITAPTLTLGRGVFTISAKQGVVLVEVGELEFCGGSASGRIGLDMSHDLTKATFTAKASDIPIDDCLRQLALDAPFTGTGAVKAELSAEGQNYDEVIQGVGGTVKVNVENGTVPVDFPRLLTTVTPLEGDGWNPNNVTSFDQIAADCRLGTGHIWCETFTMQTARGVISGSGDVDLGQQTVDWNLFVADHAQPLNTSQLSAETPPRFSISGALSQPMIRRADRPTLGEGSEPANPAAGQISPR